MAILIKWEPAKMQKWIQNNIYRNEKLLAALPRDKNEFSDPNGKKGDIYKIAFSDGKEESALSDPMVA